MNFIKLGDLCTISTGQYAPQDSNAFSDTGIPFIRAGSLESLLNGLDEYELELIEEEVAKKYKLKLYPKNTIVFAKSGMSALLGRIYKLKNPCFVVSHLATIIATDKIYTDYLAFWFRHNPPSRLIENRAYPSIKTSVIQNLTIDLPPLPTQIHIAQILDKADNLINQRKLAIAKLDELLQATFIKMFGDPVVNDRGWNTIKLDKLGKWSSGGTPSRENGSFFKGDIAWYTSGELNNIYISDSIEKISQQAIEQSSAKLIPVGSLLLGMYDTAGLKSSITTVPSACNQAIAFAKLDENLTDTKFVYHNIQLCKEYLKHQQRGVRQKNFNLSMIKNIEILNPPLNLQTQFAQIAKQIENQKIKLQTQLTELEALFLALQQKAFHL